MPSFIAAHASAIASTVVVGGLVAAAVMGGAADRELDEAKRLRSIENGPVVDVTAVAQGLSEKAEGSVNNG